MDLLALLFPREKKFYKMVEDQVSLVGEAVNDYCELISQFNKLSGKERQKLTDAIYKKEEQGDTLYIKIVQALKSTFITPMDREDLHQLVITFDTIIDTLELLTLKLCAFDIKKLDQNFIKQTKLLQKAYSIIQSLILSIRNEVQAEKYCLQVRKLEQEADKVFIEGLKSLFCDSKEAIEIIKLEDLYTSTEEMIDRLNEASLIIENLVVKYS